MNPKQDFRSRYLARINGYFLLAYLLHIPLMMGVAWYFETGVVLALGLSALICAGPLVLWLTNRGSLLTSMVMAIAGISFSALLIHLGHGMIELHFHIFVLLATFILFASPWPVLAGATTAAVHHVGFFLLLPSSVFNYQASFGIVVLHAVFVVVETVPACFIAMTFGRFILAQGLILDSVRGISDSITDNSGSLAMSSQSLTSQASAVSTAIEHATAAITEITSLVESSTGFAQQAAKISSSSVQAAQTGEVELKRLIQSIGEIASSSKKIEEIIGVIDDIAFQTNLLALNAAVEAARAGEQGKGFAVVADAVRALAQRSADAAKDVSHIIGDTVAKAETGQRAADSSGVVLNQILNSVRELAGINSQISGSSEKQESGIARVNELVGSLGQSSQESAQSSAEISQLSEGFSSHAQSLDQLVVTLIHLVDRTAGNSSQNGFKRAG